MTLIPDKITRQEQSFNASLRTLFYDFTEQLFMTPRPLMLRLNTGPIDRTNISISDLQLLINMDVWLLFFLTLGKKT